MGFGGLGFRNSGYCLNPKPTDYKPLSSGNLSLVAYGLRLGALSTHGIGFNPGS